MSEKKFTIPTTGYGADGKIHEFSKEGAMLDPAKYLNKQNQKHEKIEKMAEKMAEKIILQSIVCTNSKKGKYRCACSSEAWRVAEEFYNYAKEKEGKRK